MLHVVSFSSGLSSAIAANRVIDRFGKEAVRLVFMDTRIEDDDNYRFMDDFEKRFGVQIIRLAEGRTPYEVSRAEHVIPNNKLAPCTFRLKIELFRAWLAQQEKPLTVHIGYDVFELERCETTRKNYEGLGYAVDFPLLWNPYELRPYVQVVRTDWGIEPPRMYQIGYTHANCGGLCVKQGQGDWLRTLVNFPERFQMVEDWEREMRKNPTNANYAILKEVRNKETFPLTLETLRQRYEKSLSNKIALPGLLHDLDSKSTCIHCGVGEFVMSAPVFEKIEND